MKVVVIGGAGNIGLPGVIPALKQFGHQIAVITRSQLDIPGVECICADYRAPGFAAAVAQRHFDAVISMITFNRTDAQILLDCGAKQIVFISTVCVMGGPLEEIPARETTPVAPITRYGINKLDAELTLLGQTHTPVTIFRPASTVGPRFPILRQLAVEPDSRWIYRLENGLPIVVADSGLQKWSWCSADDAGVAVAACVGRERCFHQTYILTRPDPIDWVSYHEQVASMVGCRANLEFIPSDAIIASGLPAGLLIEQARWDQIYDVSKLKDIPEFRPSTSFETMIERCLDHRRRHSAPPNPAQDELEDQVITSWRLRRKIV